MNETDAKCIIVSAWEAIGYLGEGYDVDVRLTSRDEPQSYELCINIDRSGSPVFTHAWQEGDTIDSFLEGFNARFNSIFHNELSR